LDSDKFFWNKHRTGGIWIVRDLYESGWPKKAVKRLSQ
jgi:hypothetical protein